MNITNINTKPRPPRKPAKIDYTLILPAQLIADLEAYAEMLDSTPSAMAEEALEAQFFILRGLFIQTKLGRLGTYGDFQKARKVVAARDASIANKG